MNTYSTLIPTAFDRHITVEGRETWLVAPVSQTRDSKPLERSNFECFVTGLGGEGDDVEVHRFGHWGPGWYEVVLVRPDTLAAAKAQEMAGSLEDFPVLDESHFSRLEDQEAQEVWAKCYRTHERVEYIREHRSQFEFVSLADMLGCVRGKYFAGYASELIS